MRGLYSIIDPAHCAGRDPLEVADAVLQVGCAALQLRDKVAEPGLLATLASALARRCEQASVPFFINDYPVLAVDLGVGVHLGQQDMPIEEARALVGQTPIGISTHDLDQARQAQSRGAQLIGFGPVFQTRTKHNPDPQGGTELLRQVCEVIEIPVVAIGGIDTENVGRVRDAGADMAAVVRAVCGADDPGRAARLIHETFN